MRARCASSSPTKCGSISTGSICACSRSPSNSIWVHQPGAPVPRGAGGHARAGRRDLFHAQPWRRLVLPGTGPPHRTGAAAGPPLDVHFGAAAAPATPAPKYFDWLVLLKFCTAFEPYCQAATPPRSGPQKIARIPAVRCRISAFLRFSVDRVDRCAGARGAGRAAGAPRRGRASGRAAEGRGRFRPDRRTDGRRRRALLADITRQCEQIHEAVYASYILYGAETVL